MKKTDFNPAYVGERPDVERLIGPNTKFVLDIGFSVGLNGRV